MGHLHIMRTKKHKKNLKLIEEKEHQIENKKGISLYGIGIPIIDMIGKIKETEKVKNLSDLCEIINVKIPQYGGIEITKEQRDKILPYIEIESQVLGGSTLNTLRLMSQLVSEGSEEDIDDIFFSGAIGDPEMDGSTKKLVNLVKEEGFQTVHFETHPNESCAECICICNGTNRSLLCYYGASKKYHIKPIEIQHKYAFYTSLPMSVVAGIEDVFEAYNNNSQFSALNLSSPTYVKTYFNPSEHLKNYHMFIGNNSEFRALWKQCGKKKDSLSEFLLSACGKEYMPMNTKHKFRVFVVTNKAEDIEIYTSFPTTSSHTFKPPYGEYRPTKMTFNLDHEVKHIGDAVGTGDAFMAGFLYGLLNFKSWEGAVLRGANMASKILAVKGFDLLKLKSMQEETIRTSDELIEE